MDKSLQLTFLGHTVCVGRVRAIGRSSRAIRRSLVRANRFAPTTDGTLMSIGNNHADLCNSAIAFEGLLKIYGVVFLAKLPIIESYAGLNHVTLL